MPPPDLLTTDSSTATITDNTVVTPMPPDGKPATSATAAVVPPPAGATDWRASLPDDLKAHKGLEKFKDPAALAKSYIELDSYRGRSIALPGENATPEEVAAYRTKIGVPAAPDGYALKGPEGLTLDTGGLSTAQHKFHELGLTPAQAQGLLDYYVGELAGPDAQAKTFEAMKTATVALLQKEWGGSFEYKVSRAEAAAQLLDRQSGTHFLQTLRSVGLHNHPETIRFYEYMGRQFAEDGEIPMDASGALGPDAAKQKIAAIRNDLTHPFHKGDRAAVEEMLKLTELSLS